ncbi:cell division protein FtsX [Rhizorhapis suberifaciens]|uniref:Cell division transport system permease protein n=1 Tax=Rhizorhapis suberifaciens TaxID=13656 RepID=A0A840HS67_9SPHN|nr:FtsX-like permease family protein [Rhizorhapis suberifaciens]MBB4640418.1 cell division transport system permease protein [Rhizorhapis suberifaciens]
MRSVGRNVAIRRVLPEGRLSGPMPWVIAIMMFLTILAAAAGLGLDHAARSLRADLAGRATVQIVEANAEIREEQAGRVMTELRGLPSIRGVTRVSNVELEAALRPWLGEDLLRGDLPIPAMIDLDLAPGADIGALRDTIAAIAPSSRVEPHAAFLGPLAQLLQALKWLAVALVLLMMLATAAIVVLAARAAHNSHRTTIEVLHLMGATDVQIARLFQRRIALDALFGGLLGLVAGGLVLGALAMLVQDIGSDIMESAAIPDYGWGVLLLLPAGGVLLAMLTARSTVLRALRRSI